MSWVIIQMKKETQGRRVTLKPHIKGSFSPRPPRGISASGEVIVYLFIYLFIYSFLGPDLQHMEVPKARG